MKILRPTVLALVCGLLLATANRQMHGVIDDNRRLHEERVFYGMVDGADLVATPAGWEISRQGQLIGYLKETTTPRGYNGDITLLVAYSTEGIILGVRVSHHRETPGIGDIIETGVSDWIHGFKETGFEGTGAESTQEIDAVSGATITTRAVIQAVAETVQP